MNNTNDIDVILEQLFECSLPTESQIKYICFRARQIFIKESNTIFVPAPVTICGDVHGQFWDLKELFEIGGKPGETSYLFLGDFVDRGYYSIETFLLLLTLKVKYPDKMTLIRGNHESRQITQVYGFYDECMKKFGNSSVWRYCTEIFDYLSLSAIVENQIFCVHGGLSPKIDQINQIRLIDRKTEVPHEGAMCDMLWSDPDETTKEWEINPRGAGFNFGKLVVEKFNKINSLKIIARAHQLCQDGFQYSFDKKLVTVWSAPNYFYRCANKASVMIVNNELDHSFKVFEAAPPEKRNVKHRKTTSIYFL
ncbi:serine/threonine-protein phosphatase pp2a-related [Anaeramoeba flamelloides]|uniref:Serine/threonine-protein phosphatase n=1 Tax=Anaeramoeba flamelloides TaxID=1746091 RepID=A0ABQ8XVD6_9EUKA|nr:serine/threonine-protein phosphatase pp2a-related [Anaeramoeba flamelloides]